MKLVLILLFVFAIVGCVSVPDVYLIDRHTVMELEAAGEWPELEKRFQSEGLNSGPADIKDIYSERRKENVFTLLNGEFAETENGSQK